jgi:hypothetical protein
LLLLRGLDLPELPLIILHAVPQDLEEVLGMPGADGDDGLCPGLVRPWDLVEEDEGKLVFLVGDLDAVAVNGVQILGDVDRDLPRVQEVSLLLPREIEISLGFIRKTFTPPAIRLMFGAVMTGQSAESHILIHLRRG